MNLTLPTESSEREEILLVDGCMNYFPAALAGVAKHSKRGNDKHNPGEPMHHARGKSTGHANRIMRHLMDLQDLLAVYDRHMQLTPLNEALLPSILAEASALAWRALALSQELHERFGAPLAPGARLPCSGPVAYAADAADAARREADLVARQPKRPCKGAGMDEAAPGARLPTILPNKWTAEEERAMDEACGVPSKPAASMQSERRGFPITPGIYLDRRHVAQTVFEVDEEGGAIGARGYPARSAGDCWNLQGQYWNEEGKQSQYDLIARVGNLPSTADPAAPVWSGTITSFNTQDDSRPTRSTVGDVLCSQDPAIERAVAATATPAAIANHAGAAEYNRKFEERVARDKAKRDAPEPYDGHKADFQK